MAFTPDTLNIIVQPLGGDGIRFVNYRTDDDSDDVIEDGYFANAERFGLKLYDLIFVSPMTGGFDPFIAIVTDIDSAGDVTVTLESQHQADIRRFGIWSASADPAVNTATLIAAKNAMVSGDVGSVSVPPYAVTVTALDGPNPDEGACLIMDHTNGKTIKFVGTRGATFINPASNKIEVFAKNGDFDFILDGVCSENEHDILLLQVKQDTKVLNGGIAGHGNSTNCFVRQYDGEGLVALRDVDVRNYHTIQHHIGKNGDNTVLRGKVEQKDCYFENFVFGLLSSRAREITRDNVQGDNFINGVNGNNTDGTETDPTEVSDDPGHVVYITDRDGAHPAHQSYSNIRSTGGESSPEKIRSGELLTVANVSFTGTGRGWEATQVKRGTITNVTGRLVETSFDTQQVGFELLDCGNFTISNVSLDISAVTNGRGMKFDVGLEGNNAEVASITSGATTTVNFTGAHSLTSGTQVCLWEVEGMTAINGVTAVATVTDSDTITLPINSSGFGAYTSGGFVTTRPYANRGYFVNGAVVVQDHSNGNSVNPYIFIGQRDSVFANLIHVHDGNAAGAASFSLQAVKRCTFFLPRKIAVNNPTNSNRLMVLDADCVNNTIIITQDCVPTYNNFTIVDNGTNNNVILLDTNLADDGTVSAPGYGFASEAGLGLRRGGTGDMRFVAGSADILRFLATRFEPIVAGAVALGSTTLPFGRTFAESFVMPGISTPTAVASSNIFYTDTADAWPKWREAGGTVRRIAPQDTVEAIATDVDFTLTPNTNAPIVRHTGTLTADRAVTLSTTGAVNGTQFRVVRTGAGAFNLNVGTGPLKALATNTYADVMYDGSAYRLVGYGAL